MYKSAVTSGLIADIGPENWQTLCVIASYMDEQGECFPTQSQIAKGLGISRPAANRRVRKLAEYRWQGRPVIETIRKRSPTGQWENTRYTILPISQLRIFEAEPEDIVRD
ncbi:helix-turn-helix domain-containing protein [Salibacterium salarium]|uniref:Helix-turn-helix domain-containing protein n=2 Tax=Salibacterium salarium TaxID=284579 RepID=A0A3R9PX31_9BACI|nr:helix-turn-helix domain-containing protein [Salibacterium salarium]